MTAGTVEPGALCAGPWLLVPAVPLAKEPLPALPSACCASNVSQRGRFWLAIFTPVKAPAVPVLSSSLPVPALAGEGLAGSQSTRSWCWEQTRYGGQDKRVQRLRRSAGVRGGFLC